MNGGTWKAWVGALALVVFGFAVGVGVTAFVGVKRLRDAISEPPPARVGGGGGERDRALARIHENLTEELDLTPEETARLEAVLKQSAENLRALRQEGGRKMRAELERTVKEIGEILPPEKREAYRKHVDKRFEWLKNPPRRGEREPRK